mgnify:CR=1 FL=1
MAKIIITNKVRSFVTEEREIHIDKKKLNYLTNRIERSYKFAIRIAKKIDKESMERHSQISLSFLKKLLED